MKESFLLYKSFYDPIKELSIEDKGHLLDAIFKYQIEGIEPMNTSRIYMPFMFFKNQFRLDDAKYQKIVERNKLNGSKGGRPRNPKQPKKPSGLSGNPKNPSEPKKPDNEKDNVNEKEKEFKELVFYFSNQYPLKTLNDFFDYWSEWNKSKTKMKFQMQKTWDLNRRLKRWVSNDFNKSNGQNKENVEYTPKDRIK